MNSRGWGCLGLGLLATWLVGGSQALAAGLAVVLFIVLVGALDTM